MANLIIVHDTQREIATFVDADTQTGYGPALIGPDAGELLQSFVDALPFAVGSLDQATLTAVFQDFAQRAATSAAPAASAPPDGPLEPSGGPGVDGGGKLADATAAAATDVPAPAPADPDPDAGSPRPVRPVDCPACQGEGKLDLGDGQGLVGCNMCQGTGAITVPA